MKRDLGRQTGHQEFPITSWTFLRHAQDRSAPEYRQHLQRLVQQYWWPIYCMIRHSWRRSDDEARDLTQEFFATQLFASSLIANASAERGSFRALIRTAVGHFMSKADRNATRQKRGGDQIRISLDENGIDPDEALDLPAQASPDEAFDLAWKKSVTNRALALTQQRLALTGKQREWEIFLRYDVEDDRGELSYEQIGAPLGLSAAKVKHALLQTRALFRDTVTDIVREYVDGADDLADELKALFGA